MTKPVIYISSAFDDLSVHRKVLIENLNKTDCFTIFNIENYGGINGNSLEKYLAGAEDCEFYLFLLGDVYGPGPSGTKPGLSITDLEYKIAIGADDKTRTASTPDYKRCVLPFFLDENYVHSAQVSKNIKDQPAESRQSLSRLKKQISQDFIVGEAFTTPVDLTMKVLSALVPELVKRNYVAIVQKMMLPEGITYRCNREVARKNFLHRNSLQEKFYRPYIVHGSKSGMPNFFCRNLATYELNTIEHAEISNLEEYMASDSDDFVNRLAVNLHKNIFREWPAKGSWNFTLLALSIIESDHPSNLVIRIEINFDEWNAYKAQLNKFFNQLVLANQQLAGKDKGKSVYIFINVCYQNAREKIKEKGSTYILLDRLSDIKDSHIKQWILNYLFSDSGKSADNRNWIETIALKVTRKYFPEFENANVAMSMWDTVERLRRIRRDFNDNSGLFNDYHQLFNS